MENFIHFFFLAGYLIKQNCSTSPHTHISLVIKHYEVGNNYNGSLDNYAGQ